MSAPRKLVLVHGLLVNGHVMRPLARHFRNAGYDTLIVDYPTRSRTLTDSADAWLPRIRAFADGQALDLIGHSLGGLLIRHLRIRMPQEIRRVVTLGTPHMQSAAGAYFRRFYRGKMIGASWADALDGHAPPWDSAIPLLSIAGTKAKGLGKWFGLFRGEPSDGTVAVAETRLPQATAYCDLPYGHTGMLFAREVMHVASEWLESGTSRHPALFLNDKISHP